MKLKAFPSKKTWVSMFPDYILERGEDYWENNAVGELIFDPDENIVSAEVIGSMEYRVSVFLSEDGGTICEMECNCPYAVEGNNCKHMAALLYAIEDRKKTESVKEKQENTVCVSLSDELADTVNRLSPEDMRKILMEAAENDPALRDRLLYLSRKPIPRKWINKWKLEMDNIIEEAQGEFGWDEDDFYDMIDELGEFLSEKVVYLNERGAKEEAFRLVCDAYDKVFSISDEYNDDFDYFSEKCTELWDELLRDSTPEFRCTVYPWFEKNNDCSFIDYMMKAFPDEELLQRQLVFLDRLISEAGENVTYQLKNLVNDRLECMQRLALPETELAAFRKKYHAFPDVRKQEIDLALRRRDYETAETLLRESLVLDRDFSGLIDDYYRQLLALFEKSGQREKYQYALSEYVLKHSQSDLTYVLKLKEIVPPEAWETIRETIFTDSVHYSIRYDLMESEGLYRRLFDELTGDYCSQYTLLQYEKTLKAHFPDELRDVLLTVADHAMETASTRSAYAAVIASLKRIQTYPGGKKRLTELTERWRITYRRRPAMLQELNKAGF